MKKVSKKISENEKMEHLDTSLALDNLKRLDKLSPLAYLSTASLAYASACQCVMGMVEAEPLYYITGTLTGLIGVATAAYTRKIRKDIKQQIETVEDVEMLRGAFKEIVEVKDKYLAEIKELKNDEKLSDCTRLYQY